MIDFFDFSELWTREGLATQMFEHRAQQFGVRLGWNVRIDELGMERDKFDTVGTTYVVSSDQDGRHLASLRVRDFSGDCLTKLHFASLCESMPLPKSRVLEVSRLCRAPELGVGHDRQVESLIHGVFIYMATRNYRHALAVFERSMLPIYKQAGWKPSRLSSKQVDGEFLTLGVWDLLDYSPYWFSAPANTRMSALVGT